MAATYSIYKVTFKNEAPQSVIAKSMPQAFLSIGEARRTDIIKIELTVETVTGLGGVDPSDLG